MSKLKGIDLFSGIGGFTLGLHSFVDTLLFCEIDVFCRSVLQRHFPAVPIHDDVKTLRDSIAKYALPPIDIVFGGFPCQDISRCGRGAGVDGGARSGLFFRVVEVVALLRPKFVFLENVSAIRSRGLNTVLRELCSLGYTCHWFVLMACSMGAPHQRSRWFLFAYREIGAAFASCACSTCVFQWKRRFECDASHDRHVSAVVGDCVRCNEPSISHVYVNSKQERSACSALGNAVIPRQCHDAFVSLARPSPADLGRPTLLSELEQRAAIPSSGVARCTSDGLFVYPFTRWEYNRVDVSDFTYPTPTHVLRSSEGMVRCARRLLLANKISYLDAAAMAGKCPLDAQGCIPAYDGNRDAIIPPEFRDQKNFVANVNVRWVEWLMGFPPDFV